MDALVRTKDGFASETEAAGDALVLAMQELRALLDQGVEGHRFSVEFEDIAPDNNVEGVPQITPFQGDNRPNVLSRNTFGYCVKLYLSNNDLGDLPLTMTCILDRNTGAHMVRLDTKGPLEEGNRCVILPNDNRRRAALKNFLSYLIDAAKPNCPPAPPRP